MLSRKERKFDELVTAVSNALRDNLAAQLHLQRLLERIAASLEETIQHQRNANREANVRYQDAKDAMVTAFTQLQTNAPPHSTGQNRKRQSGPHPWLKFALEGLLCVFTAGAFGATLWYAFISDRLRMSSDMQIGTLVRQVETAEMANQIADENGQITQKQSETALRASMRIAEAEQRAWVESELTLLEPMTLVRQEVSAGIGVAFENSGHSPAVNAKVAMRFVEWPSVPPNADRSASDAYWRREMRKTCEQAKTEKVVVATIFPGKPQGFPIVVHVVWDLSTYKNREGDILPSLLSCIDYQFPESDRHHQTAYFSFIGDFVDGITRRAVLVNANHGRFSIIAPPEMKIVRFKTPIAN